MLKREDKELKREMGIKRKEVTEPGWYMDDYADVSNYDLFSDERWGVNVEWDILLEQAKKIDAIVLLIDKHDYPSQLFLSYIDIFEANLYIYDDLFYCLIGEHIGNDSIPGDGIPKNFANIYKRLFFWNLDCRDIIKQIHEELTQVLTHIVKLLNQKGLEVISNRVAEEWCWGFYLNAQDNDAYEIIWAKDRALQYAIGAYKGKILLKPLVKQIVNALNILSNAIYFFRLGFELPKDCFPALLEKFRSSEKGQNFVKAWKRDFEGSRDYLIASMEKSSELSPWVHRYLHIRENESVIEQLFYDEITGFMLNDEEYYNTNNWISILKIATLLHEYEERHSKPAKKVSKKSKTIKTFREFIVDAERTNEIIEKLHRLIGNKTNTDALKIITRAMWIDWIARPTATSIKNEFPTIVCSSQMISKCLNEEKPTHPSNAIEKIRLDYERA